MTATLSPVPDHFPEHRFPFVDALKQTWSLELTPISAGCPLAGGGLRGSAPGPQREPGAQPSIYLLFLGSRRLDGGCRGFPGRHPSGGQKRMLRHGHKIAPISMGFSSLSAITLNTFQGKKELIRLVICIFSKHLYTLPVKKIRPIRTNSCNCT